MSSYYWAFWYAVVFLTRLPAPYLKRVDDEVAQKSLLFYPVVGAVIGALLIAFILICWWYNPQASPLLVAALTTAIWILLSGGLHLDGLADSADAWVGGLGDKERTLEIMKDPRVGPIGVLAVMLVLLVQFAGVQVLLDKVLLEQATSDWFYLTALILIPALARASALGLLASTPYVRAKGLATALVSGATQTRLLVTGVILAVTAVVVFQHKAILVLLLYLAVNVFARQMMIKRIGGCTGDTMGATIAVQEALLLAALTL